MAIEALGDHPLVRKINDEVADLLDTSIDLTGQLWSPPGTIT
jgi:hypothetical protein